MIYSHSIRRIISQHYVDSFLSFRTDSLIVLNFTMLNKPEQLILVAGTERETSIQHEVKNDSNWPNIGCFAFIEFMRNNLRCHVRRSATKTIQQLACIATESEIDNFNRIWLIYENVFKLQVPMANTIVMAV